MTLAILTLWLGSALGYYFADPEESVWGAIAFLPVAVLVSIAFPIMVIVLGLALLVSKVRQW